MSAVRPVLPFRRGAHPSLRAAIYDALREDLMTGRLPPGKTIGVKDVRRAFGVGLSAVREALCQLTADGLVIAEEQHGFRATPVSAHDLLDVTRARVEIETFALRDAIAHGDVDWEAQILAAAHKLAQIRGTEGRNPRVIGDAYRQQHAAFHDALVAACSSQWMQRFRRTLHVQSERYRQLAVWYNDEPRDVNEEHRALVEAVLARDADRATALMTEHINATARILVRLGVTERDA
jgi:DNA-binding GntR family transcriptional regulator